MTTTPPWAGGRRKRSPTKSVLPRLHSVPTTATCTGRSSAPRKALWPRSVVVPLQDVFGLDSGARMNTPSSSDGNWGWRYKQGLLTSEAAKLLAEIAETTDRDELLRDSSGNQQGHGEAVEEFAA